MTSGDPRTQLVDIITLRIYIIPGQAPTDATLALASERAQAAAAAAVSGAGSPARVEQDR